MTKEELREYNIELNLRNLMRLDPRGYGVCRILEYANNQNPPSSLMQAARTLKEKLKKDAVLFIFTGFVLQSHEAAETDGLIGSMLLAGTVIKSFGAKPIIICPKECVKAVRNCGNLLGFHVYDEIGEVLAKNMCIGVFPFTKNPKKAARCAEKLINQVSPEMMVAIEAAGANEKGIYHNAAGCDVTKLEAKSEVLWKFFQSEGIPSLAIGDLGNELGMGSLRKEIVRFVPRTGVGECTCKCKSGIMAAGCADQVITATCSDWGCYALISALAYITDNMQLLPQKKLYKALLREGVRSGLIDMTGALLPHIDGFCLELNAVILELMNQCVRHAIIHKEEYLPWEQEVLQKGFFAKT